MSGIYADAVDVIIPVYKQHKLLESLLASLKIAIDACPLPVQVYVANDGACQKVSEVCRALEVQEIVCPERKGSYYARNRAIERSSGKYIAFTDADATVDPQWLYHGINALYHTPYVGGNVQIPFQPDYSLAERCEYLYAFDVRRYMSEFSFAPTANLFIHREILHVAGLFDERLHSGGDKAFGKAVQNHGIPQTLCMSATVYHPPRDLSGLIKKVCRVAHGSADICYYNAGASGNSLKPKPENYSLLKSQLCYFISPPIVREASGYTKRKIFAASLLWRINFLSYVILKQMYLFKLRYLSR